MGGTGKKKIELKKIQQTNRRFVTFCKRRNGLFKKVEELALLTGASLAALVFSPTAAKLHTSGDMVVIDRYINDTKSDAIDVDLMLQIHACINLDDVTDVHLLSEMKNQLLVIRNTLLQQHRFSS